MTFEVRAAEAASELADWTPGDPGSETVVRRARRRTHRRQVALGGVTLMLAAASTVLLWPGERPQRVISAESPTTTPSPDARSCARWANADVIVFMSPAATPEYIAAVGSRLDDDPRVSSSQYLDNAASYELFKQIFQSTRPEMIGAVRPGDLPTEYTVVLTDKTEAESFVTEMTAMPGVYSVDDEGRAIHPPAADGSLACRRGADDTITAMVLGGTPTSTPTTPSANDAATSTTAVPVPDSTGTIRVRLDLDAVPTCPPTASCVDPATAQPLDGIAVEVLDPVSGTPIDPSPDGRVNLYPGTFEVQVHALAGSGCPGTVLRDAFRLVVGVDASLRLDGMNESHTTILAAGPPTPPGTPADILRMASLTGRLQLPYTC